MNTMDDFFNATEDEQARVLRRHLGTYPGPLYEATRVTARLADRRIPTHKGKPNA